MNFTLSLPQTLTLLPSNQLSRSRKFYLYYDGVYALLCLALLAIWQVTGAPNLLPRWNAWCWAILPLACYGQILCSVMIHNAAHANFPRKLSRTVGEICGAIVLTRFASWEIIHRRHHRYTDIPGKDPHPVQPGYWKFLWATIANVEVQLQTNFVELYGDTPENRRFEKYRAYVSYLTNIVLILVWRELLGSAGFLFIFIPASIVGFLHLIHFNWTTHDAHNPQGVFSPIDQDQGIYWIGNRLLFGIYNHGIHHRCTRIFNPANRSEVRRKLG